MAEILWHYTTGGKFVQIVESGEIRPATANVPEGERPITWFSSNQWFEPTAQKALTNEQGHVKRLGMAGTAELGGGLVRIGIAAETAPHDWRTLRELAGISSKMAQIMYQNAIEQGARPGEWRGTFDTVPREKWIAVEVFHEGKWTPVPLASE